MFNIIFKGMRFFKYGFGVCLSFVIPVMSMEIDTTIIKGSPSNIHQKMLSNCLPAMLETYHGDDWAQVNTLAAASWRDPGNILRVAIDGQVNKIYPVLLQTFLNNEVAAKKFMTEYFFHVQCERLYAHYLENKSKTYSYFRSFPTEYSATLAYEDKALEMGISLEPVYHQIYLIESERAKRIEVRNEDISKPKEGQGMKNGAKRKAPSMIKSAPRKPYRIAEVLEFKIQPVVTTIQTPSMNGDVLEDIRKGSFKLRPVRNVRLNDRGRPKNDAEKDFDSFTAIMKKRFDVIHGHNEEVKVKQEDEW